MITPRPLLNAVLRSVCGRDPERLVPLTGGGMNETYRVELGSNITVVARIAHQPEPWFLDEAHLMAQARAVGVPTPEVLGLKQQEHEGELLSFSIQQFLPGRSLDELVDELSTSDFERLVSDAGELLARIHSLPNGTRGTRHELRSPDEDFLARVRRIVEEALGPAAAAVIEQGADVLRAEATSRPTSGTALAQGDFMPKNLLVHEAEIAGVIDWEFAGPASPAFDLARWEVSAGDPFHDRSDLVRRGYARVADPESAAAGLVPAFAIDWALEVLAWRNPATPAQFRRCVNMIARYAVK